MKFITAKLLKPAAILSLFAFWSCKTINPLTDKHGKDAVKNIPLKYPVVLVHGIYAHDRGKPEKFWGRIPQELEKCGIKVYFGNTDAWGGYDSNAKLLHDTIEHILQETNSKKVNIIAHSKGGLDSRYFIWKYHYGNKVASLTTVSTPHHGAEIADLVFNQKIIHSRGTKKALTIFGELYGDSNPDLYGVNYQLTTDYMKKFNENVIMDRRVYYQSVYSVMDNSFDDLMFYYSHQYIKKISGDNDGLVSEYSAKWGDNVIKIAGGISHAEIVDFNKKKKISGIYIPDIYLNIVTELSEMGF
jgi:triacylglycerol lipase